MELFIRWSFTGSKKALDLNQVGLGGRAERVVETLRLLNDNKEAKLIICCKCIDVG